MNGGDADRGASFGSEIFDASSAYVDALAALDPYWATFQGVAGHERETSNFSPEGVQATAALNRQMAHELRTSSPHSDPDRVARDVLLHHLEMELAAFDAGDWQSDLNVICSPLQSFCDVFDVMAADTIEDWEAQRDRLWALPKAIGQYRSALEIGILNGQVAAQRQAIACAQQCAVRSRHFSRRGHGSEELPASLLAEHDQAAASAGAAYGDFGEWLSTEYRACSRTEDGVGVERYVREASKFIGMTIDPRETYYWGLEQVHDVWCDMKSVAAEIDNSLSLREVINVLDTDPTRAVHGTQELAEFLQLHLDSMLLLMDGMHFDIDPRARHIEVRFTPNGGSPAQYYTAPSEDWTRPGRYCYPMRNHTSFPRWSELTVAHHEGVPGHHLQVTASMAASSQLSRFQRLYFNSGHGEGWAVYAERLCHDLGLLKTPEYVLGWLREQLLRAVRVVVDIGMHCGEELNIGVPFDAPAAAGAPWGADSAFAYARHYLGHGFDMRCEIDRYLGWPGQAISYTIGEREWLGARGDAQRSLGASFDLKAFHTAALGLGAMGLAQLRPEILRALISQTS